MVRLLFVVAALSSCTKASPPNATLPSMAPAQDEVVRIKARGDKAGAEVLISKYVEGKAVPHAIVQERFRRQPKASFGYAVTQ